MSSNGHMAGKRTYWIIAALLTVPFALGVGRRRWESWSRTWQDWRYPAPKSPAVSPLGEEILRRQDSESMTHFLREYHRIQSQVDAAEDRGSDVAVLKGRMKDSTILARRGDFRRALFVLN